MGSIAMNSLGDIALGFSASNTTTFPSVFYTARHPGDPPGQMTLGEGSIKDGTCSQTGGGSRWGDYTSLVVDPTDDTTFWYINEYVPTTSNAGWRLRVGAFNLAGGGTPTPTPTPTATPCPGNQYAITAGTDTIVPGTTDTGLHTDDGDTFVSFPSGFTFQLYDQTYNGVNVNTNGRLDFLCVNEPNGYQIGCIPPSDNQCSYDFTIFPVWNDYMTTLALAGCAGFPGGNCGIFTSVSGSAPNRIFNIEWRTVLYDGSAGQGTQNFEVRLYENGGPDNNQRFDVIYGAISNAGADSPWMQWVAGVQGNSGAAFFSQDFCLAAADQPPQNVSRTYTLQGCGTPTPTPTATPTATPTGTPSATPTATPTVTPTATPRATPRPRPTPHRRPT
jgi:hypothetical protein